MSERDPQRWSRFALSVLALLAVGVAAPIGLIAAARSRFGSANPLSGADPPWRWGSDQVGDAITGPIADDTVIDGIIRLSLCVVWVALAVIVVTTLVEVVHAVRHHGLGLPDIRGVGWAQRIARFIAVGLVAVLPMMASSTSLASTLDARAVAAASTDSSIRSPFRELGRHAAAARCRRRSRHRLRRPTQQSDTSTWWRRASRSTRSLSISQPATRRGCSTSRTTSSMPTSAR